MSREIIFKAKRKDNGEWVEGGYFKEPYTDNVFIIQWNSFGLGFHEFIEVLPETVCQYTGLTDKNGRKIWGNDGWIPVDDTEHTPKDENYVLVSFSNYILPDIARYEENEKGGTYYPGDDE